MSRLPAEEQLVLELFVRDLAVSLAFYSGLGFEVERKEEDLAALRWEERALLLQHSTRLGERPPRPFGNLRIMVDDVDACWANALHLGAPVFNPIADRDYGLRDFIVLDPDGFGVRFASYV